MHTGDNKEKDDGAECFCTRRCSASHWPCMSAFQNWTINVWYLSDSDSKWMKAVIVTFCCHNICWLLEVSSLHAERNVVTWHAWGVVRCVLMALLQISWKYATESIFAIGQYLLKILSRVWLLFLTHCVYLWISVIADVAFNELILFVLLCQFQYVELIDDLL